MQMTDSDFTVNNWRRRLGGGGAGHYFVPGEKQRGCCVRCVGNTWPGPALAFLVAEILVM